MDLPRVDIRKVCKLLWDILRPESPHQGSDMVGDEGWEPPHLISRIFDIVCNEAWRCALNL